MAKLVRYKPSFRGMKVLRSSRRVDAMLEHRARRVASQAQLLYDVVTRIGGGERVQVDVVQLGSDTVAPRARVAVIARSPAALRMEADHRVLGNSLMAAGVSKRNIKTARLQLSRRAVQKAAERAARSARRAERKAQRDAELFAREEAV